MCVYTYTYIYIVCACIHIYIYIKLNHRNQHNNVNWLYFNFKKRENTSPLKSNKKWGRNCELLIDIKILFLASWLEGANSISPLSCIPEKRWIKLKYAQGKEDKWLWILAVFVTESLLWTFTYIFGYIKYIFILLGYLKISIVTNDVTLFSEKISIFFYNEKRLLFKL